jgi:hypothetical protein
MASTAPNYYEFYRKSSYVSWYLHHYHLDGRLKLIYRAQRIGRTLSDTLEDLITDGTITPQLEAMILRHFDRVMTEVLASKVKEGLTFKVLLIN